jgi:hypothetical protein
LAVVVQFEVLFVLGVRLFALLLLLVGLLGGVLGVGLELFTGGLPRLLLGLLVFVLFATHRPPSQIWLLLQSAALTHVDDAVLCGVTAAISFGSF